MEELLRTSRGDKIHIDNDILKLDMAVTQSDVQSPKTQMDLDSLSNTVQNGQSFPPTAEDLQRLNNYNFYSSLFLGDHYNAFGIRISDHDYNKAYSRLRYVMVNFAGLLSKIVADMLISEPPVVKVSNKNQDFVDAFWRENQMDIQLYESALSNSYLGDAVFKLRAGKRNTKDTESTVIAEDITPTIYFPEIDGFNVRANPKSRTLAWTFKVGDKTYLRKEIHTAGLITNKVYEMAGNKIKTEVDLSVLRLDGIKPEVSTGISESLIIHTPNWKTGNRYYGISDYFDLQTLFYAINNRMTKVDNILDKHSDPILMVPEGILDEKGDVRKGSLGVIEMQEGETGKPEYIVWDASLENAFKQIDKLTEMLYMIGEITPDTLGMGQGQSDSGRALKFKLMRTLAKVQRKRLYYDRAIKELVYTAQKFAKANNLKIDGKAVVDEPMTPEIDWKDGLPNDEKEMLENEMMAIDAGITSKKDSMMRVYGYDDQTAENKLKEVEDEKPKVALPVSNMGKDNPFNQNKNDEGDENK